LVLRYWPAKVGEGKSCECAIAMPLHVYLAKKADRRFLAYKVWEYIQLYMQEGRAALPDFEETVQPFYFEHPRQIVQTWHPRAFVRRLLEYPKFLLPVTLPLALCIGLPCWLLCYPTDLLFMVFDRVLPRRRWPAALIEAGDGVWDGANDYGVTVGGGGKVDPEARQRARRFMEKQRLGGRG
ncbi:MAG: hypothetical protein LBL69_01235, partial [Zoogloeaceae bacterium]|nr:hypothetical protein [Zoogloeaceae bacterium]